jgi:hypothetical protein
MPSLAQLSGAETDPTITVFTTNITVVEPLDGPSTVDDVMDRFPEEVYQQGRDTHLYRFLQALGGDSGAGLLKKQTFATRLRYEAEFMNFQVLDDFYAAQFRFNRLLPETYTFDTSVEALTPTQWDQIQLADQGYKHRIADFFTATRYGNSNLGIATMAQAGSGIQSDVIAHYKFIYDQFSDDQLGLDAEGTSLSTNEFVVIPRFLNATADVFDQDYQQTHARSFTFVPPTLASGVRPVPAPVGGSKLTVTLGYEATSKTRMLPEIERNVIDLIDRLRAADTFGTVIPNDIQYIDIPINGDAFSSSERIHVSRLVEGSAGVPWPTRSTIDNNFIESGVENEAGYYYGSQRELPVVFHTVEGIHAYTDAALSDPLYGTNEFYESVGGTSQYDIYASQHYGLFPNTLSALFPFLVAISADAEFLAESAVAITNTPLVMEGRAV